MVKGNVRRKFCLLGGIHFCIAVSVCHFFFIYYTLFHFAPFQFTVSDEGKTTLSEAIKEGTDMPTLFFSVAAQKYLGIQGKSSGSHYATDAPVM